MTSEVTFPNVLKKLMDDGVGHPDNRNWSQQALSEAVGISRPLVQKWLAGKVQDPTAERIERLIEVMFSDQVSRQNYPAELLFLRSLISSKNDQEIRDVDSQMFTKRQVWDILLRPVRDNVQVFLTDSGDWDDTPGFDYAHLSSEPCKKSFFVPVPNWFREWATTPAADGVAPYEINDPIDFTGDPNLSDLEQYYPYEKIHDLIAKHAEAYARAVHKAHTDGTTTSLPYNKPKTGLYSWSQTVPQGVVERAYLKITPYETDYFTNRVMLGVMKEIRQRRPEAFSDIGLFPKADRLNLSYFTTSLGLNAVVVTADPDGPHFHMAELTNNIGNVNQRGRLHISANEAMNKEDIDGKHLIDYKFWVDRALSEELGIIHGAKRQNGEPIAQDAIFLDFSMEMTNYEPYMSVVIFLNITSERLQTLMRSNARDARRETQRLHRFPFTRSGIMDLLIDAPKGYLGFTTYCLNILDMIMNKDMLEIFRQRIE